MMDILVLDPKSTNTAYLKREQSGRIVPVGFGELMDKLVRFSELEGAVILAHDDEEIPPDECIDFSMQTLNNPTVVKYLEKKKAIGCLFTKVFGIWVQTGVRLVQSRMQIIK